MKSITNRRIAMLLAVALLFGALTGCFGTAPEGSDLFPYPEGEEPRPTPIPLDTAIPCDGRLSISYVSGDPLNPFTTNNRENLAVGGLIYEGLFALDDNFTATPVLAQNLTTVDGMRYTLEIMPGITFQSGEYLTVADVIYSLNRAKESSVFGGRLSVIEEYARRLDSQGELLPYELEITLNQVHGNLPVLLTFPIIQRGTMGWRVPSGTGPYRYVEDGGLPRLMQFDAHRYSAYLPIDVIYLIEVDTLEQQTALFNTGRLDIVALDPANTGIPGFSFQREVRYFEASLMDYIGFNVQRPETGRLDVRRAISYAIDRDYIVDNILLSQAVASPLPLHPALAFYDHALAEAHSHNMARALEIMEQRWIEFDRPTPTPRPIRDEYDEEAPSEEYEPEEAEPEPEAEAYPEEEGEPERPTLRLLVVADNTIRMEVVVYIAERISALGYQVDIIDLPFHEYLFALENGNFDLFFAQVRLQPDFDLREVLFGDLAFGGIENLVHRGLVDAFLASGQSDREEAAYHMCAAILETMPISVIGFRHLAVATMRGRVVGMRPTQDNLYQGVQHWTVNLGE